MKKNLVVLTLIATCSCAVFKDFSKDYQEPEVRFVDMNGNARPVELKTPPKNIDALNQQGNLSSKRLASQPAAQTSEERISQNKYAQSNTQTGDLRDTLAMPLDDQNQPAANDLMTAQNDEIVEKQEYDLAQIEDKKQAATATAIVTKKTPLEKKVAAKKVVSKGKSSKITHGYYAQAGSFGEESHALAHINKVKKIASKSAKFHIQEAKVKGKIYHRVIIGPYKTRKSAQDMASSLKKKGQNAILIKVK